MVKPYKVLGPLFHRWGKIPRIVFLNVYWRKLFNLLTTRKPNIVHNVVNQSSIWVGSCS